MIDELVQKGMIMAEGKLDNMPGISFVCSSIDIKRKKKKEKFLYRQ